MSPAIITLLILLLAAVLFFNRKTSCSCYSTFVSFVTLYHWSS
jgi:hypothetical protein